MAYQPFCTRCPGKAVIVGCLGKTHAREKKAPCCHFTQQPQSNAAFLSNFKRQAILHSIAAGCQGRKSLKRHHAAILHIQQYGSNAASYLSSTPEGGDTSRAIEWVHTLRVTGHCFWEGHRLSLRTSLNNAKNMLLPVHFVCKRQWRAKKGFCAGCKTCLVTPTGHTWSQLTGETTRHTTGHTWSQLTGEITRHTTGHTWSQLTGKGRGINPNDSTHNVSDASQGNRGHEKSGKYFRNFQSHPQQLIEKRLHMLIISWTRTAPGKT
eukprot:1161289-Pelagomonas_calceolata.AAC.4